MKHKMISHSIFDSGNVISIAGAGGKTSLMFYLARHASVPCIVTTTTKVGKEQIKAADIRMSLSDFLNDSDDFRDSEVIWVSPMTDDGEGKIKGFDQDRFSLLAEKAAESGMLIINEADGAHFRHIKAPGENEPVIPSETTAMLFVTGLDVIGKQVNEENVHRLEQFEVINGCRTGCVIDQDLIIHNIIDPRSGFKNCPETAARIAVLNQADSPSSVKTGREIGAVLLENGIHEVWISSLWKGNEMIYQMLRIRRNECHLSELF